MNIEVGDTLLGEDLRGKLLPGAVVHMKTDPSRRRYLSKVGREVWPRLDIENDQVSRLGDSCHYVVEALHLPVGHAVTSKEEFRRLPVGAQTTYRDEHLYTKTAPGTWVRAKDGEHVKEANLVIFGGHVVTHLPFEEPEPTAEERLTRLRDKVADLWGEDATPPKAVVQAFEEAGVPLVTEESVPVQVHVNGTTRLPREKLADLIGPVWVSGPPTRSFGWVFEFVSYQTVRKGQCACASVTDQDVNDYLNANDIQWAFFTFNRTCPNDQNGEPS